MRSYLAFLILTIFCWQSYWWRSEAARVTGYQLKLFTGRLSLKEEFEWGKTAVRLKEYNSAISIFNRMAQKHRKLSPVIEQLAIVYAQNEQCDESMKRFDLLRSQATPGPISWYWNGYCREKARDFPGARESYYLSISASLEATPAAESLGFLLGKQGYRDEALSLIASVSNGHPFQSDRCELLNSELLRIIQQTNYNSDEKIKSIRIPGVLADSFWIALRLGPGTDFEFVKINTGFEFSQMSSQFWQRLNASTNTRRDLSTVEAKNLEAIEFGPWMLESTPIKVCEKCETVFGKDLLSHFEYDVDKEFGVRFLSLRQ